MISKHIEVFPVIFNRIVDEFILNASLQSLSKNLLFSEICQVFTVQSSNQCDPGFERFLLRSDEDETDFIFLH